MIIYEVNLTINNEIFDDYYQWLLQHMQQMLTFTGFKKAEVGQIDEKRNHQKQLRVSYTIESSDDLDNYIKNHADKMRAEGIEKFGTNFSANRRIIVSPIVFESK